MSDTKATVLYSGDDLFVGISPSGHAHAIDVKGDRKAAATPMELLLTAVGACTGADVVSILRKKREKVTGYRIEITGERAADYPKRWTRMHVTHYLTGVNLSEAAVQRAVELSDEKYCSVAASLRPTVTITSSYVIEEEGKADSESAA
jgi:putative redox protein